MYKSTHLSDLSESTEFSSHMPGSPELSDLPGSPEFLVDSANFIKRSKAGQI